MLEVPSMSTNTCQHDAGKRLKHIQTSRVWYKSHFFILFVLPKLLSDVNSVGIKCFFSWNPTSKRLLDYGLVTVVAMTQDPQQHKPSSVWGSACLTTHTGRLKCTGAPSCRNHSHCLVSNKTSSNNWGLSR